MALLCPHLKGACMKKTISILLTILILLTFAACGSKKNAPAPTTTAAPTEAPETTTEAPETTTEAPETTEPEQIAAEIEETKKEITGVYIPAGQDAYGITEENLNKITFKDGKAYVQMNFLDAVAEFKVNYTLDEKKGTITLGAGKAQNGTVVFNKGVTLKPDEYWQTMTIKGMEKAFVLEGYACPEFFLDGTAFNRADQ